MKKLALIIISILIITCVVVGWFVTGGKIFKDSKTYETYIGKEVIIVHFVVWRIWGEIVVSDDLVHVQGKLVSYSNNVVMYKLGERIYMIPTKYVKEIVLINKKLGE